MKFGFSLMVRGRDATVETFALMAERSEVLELDSMWCSAHVVLPTQAEAGHGLTPAAKYPDHWKEGYWEPFAVLSLRIPMKADSEFDRRRTPDSTEGGHRIRRSRTV